MAEKIRITLKRSLAGKPETMRATAAALGLHRREQSVIQSDTPSIRGMIHKISHLVAVDQVEGEVD
ncbi:MAG: 50S ribosomal protein L30 [Firmicutes bacterium]|nr:50S ribosomal protein L30 [Bacillota bacterium]